MLIPGASPKKFPSLSTSAGQWGAPPQQALALAMCTWGIHGAQEPVTIEHPYLVGGLVAMNGLFSHEYWVDVNHPNGRTHIFQRGGEKPPTSHWTSINQRFPLPGVSRFDQRYGRSFLPRPNRCPSENSRCRCGNCWTFGARAPDLSGQLRLRSGSAQWDLGLAVTGQILKNARIECQIERLNRLNRCHKECQNRC